MTYTAYGLQLHVNKPLLGLVPSSLTTKIDVYVWLQSMPPRMKEMLAGAGDAWYVSPFLDEKGEPVLTAWTLAGGEYFRLRYSDGTEFLLDRKGTEIWSTWPETLTIEDTAVYLLGPILGFVLRLRGVICLHASAICVNDQAIALVGPAGAGKSTTAAAFAKLGYPVLSDDVVALSDDRNSFMVQPAYPLVRLWPTSVNMLYGLPDALPRLVPGNSSWDKCYLDLTEKNYNFQQRSIPLAAMYLIGDRCDDRAAPFTEEVPANAGLLAMVANTYANYLLDKPMRAQEFELLNRLLSTIPLRRVIPHKDPAYLSKLCDVILDDFHRTTNSDFHTTVVNA